MTTTGTATLVFDGECGFCTAAATWAALGWAARGRRPPPQAVPWQELGCRGLAELGLTLDDARRAAWWVEPGRRAVSGHGAAGRAMEAGSGCRRMIGAAMLTPPISLLAALGYRLVARYRHRLPGATPACSTNSR